MNILDSQYICHASFMKPNVSKQNFTNLKNYRHEKDVTIYARSDDGQPDVGPGLHYGH